MINAECRKGIAEEWRTPQCLASKASIPEFCWKSISSFFGSSTTSVMAWKESNLYLVLVLFWYLLVWPVHSTFVTVPRMDACVDGWSESKGNTAITLVQGTGVGGGVGLLCKILRSSWEAFWSAFDPVICHSNYSLNMQQLQPPHKLLWYRIVSSPGPSIAASSFSQISTFVAVSPHKPAAHESNPLGPGKARIFYLSISKRLEQWIHNVCIFSTQTLALRLKG